MTFTTVFVIIQFIFSCIIGIYFYTQLKRQESSKTSIEKESRKKMEQLHRLRRIHLTEPLAEKTRPQTLQDIVGQEEGIKALKAALCGPNPQHVLIYGPPGVGKTAAARVILEEAKKSATSPFQETACFVEMDATTMRFDDRGIADPLIGTVHDPIYQGAGAYGAAGIPQPKEGAVTKAHGGVLFLDEIGELHPIQMNKLLKVLEDRKVMLESSYYSSENSNIPSYIHEIFQKGLPADFRLIGATTRGPEDIPPAIRSRCTEIYFRGLRPDEIRSIVEGAAEKGGFTLEEGIPALIASYCDNGRDAVNILQTAGSSALLEERTHIDKSDVEWVLEFGQYVPREAGMPCKREPSIGCVYGIGVTGGGQGHLMEMEVRLEAMHPGREGVLIITGLVEEEELERGQQKLRRTSTAKASVHNALTLLKAKYAIEYHQYDIHINIPGGMPVDGPSAGTALLCALYSAFLSCPIPPNVAMTGEIFIWGDVLPVGGVQAKIEAAEMAGMKRVFIPAANWKKCFEKRRIQVIPVDHIDQLLADVFQRKGEDTTRTQAADAEREMLSAEGLGR